MLYPVLTPGFTKGRPILEVLEAALKGGAKIIQLRDKEDPARYAASFREITRKHGALLIINDSLETAIKYQADGVHLGQSDLSIKIAKEKAPDLIIGASATTLSEAQKAEADGADYIALGPIFPTSTKTDIDKVIGINSLKEIMPLIKKPIVAIGGINAGNLDQLLDIGVRHFAMISAVSEADDVEGTVRKLTARIA